MIYCQFHLGLRIRKIVSIQIVVVVVVVVIVEIKTKVNKPFIVLMVYSNCFELH